MKDLTEVEVQKVVNFIVEDTKNNPDNWHHPMKTAGRYESKNLCSIQHNEKDIGTNFSDQGRGVVVGVNGLGIAWYKERVKGHEIKFKRIKEAINAIQTHTHDRERKLEFAKTRSIINSL